LEIFGRIKGKKSKLWNSNNPNIYIVYILFNITFAFINN
jgi:hypothetical protein